MSMMHPPGPNDDMDRGLSQSDGVPS